MTQGFKYYVLIISKIQSWITKGVPITAYKTIHVRVLFYYKHYKAVLSNNHIYEIAQRSEQFH
jgi:hypothetical protein